MDYVSFPFVYCQLYSFIKLTNWSIYIAFFYVCVSIILIAIGAVVYISYSDRKQASKPTWTVYLSKNLLFLFLTIFFYPILEYMLSLMECRMINGTYYHNVFTTEVCWASLHLIHSIIACIMSVIFVIFCLIISLIYYEAKANTRDFNSK